MTKITCPEVRETDDERIAESVQTLLKNEHGRDALETLNRFIDALAPLDASAETLVLDLLDCYMTNYAGTVMHELRRALR